MRERYLLGSLPSLVQARIKHAALTISQVLQTIIRTDFEKYYV